MPGRVDKVEDVVLAGMSAVVETRGLGLDRDAFFAFELHGIQHLILKIARRNSSGAHQQAVGQGGLPVIDVSDDRKIPDSVHVGGLL